MAYSYDINSSKKDKRSSGCLFGCHAINEIVGLFLNVFLIALIYNYVTDVNDYIYKVCVFVSCNYIFMALAQIPFAYLVEKTNRVWVYRLGILSRTALVVGSIFFGKNIANMLVLAGALNGITSALYYSGYNTIKQEMVSRKSMRSFAVLCQIIQLTIKLVVPVVMGRLIDVSTFSQVAIYVCIICAVQIGLSFGVASKKPEASKFNLKGYFVKLKTMPEVYKKMKALYIGAFIYGFTTIVGNLLNVCIMMQFGSNFSLGAISSIFSVVCMITILLFNKFTKKGKRSALYIFLAILPFLTTVLFVSVPCVTTLIIYNLGVDVTNIIYKTVYDVYRNGILKEAGLYSEITEHQTVVELLFSSSRVLSHVVVLLLVLIPSLVAYKLVLCISVLSYSAMILFLLVWEKRFISTQNIEKNQVDTTNLNKSKEQDNRQE